MIDRFERFKIETVTEPPTEDVTLDVYIGRYWVVTNNGDILRLRYASAQCNLDKRIAEMLARPHEGATVKFLPIVYLPHNCE